VHVLSCVFATFSFAKCYFICVVKFILVSSSFLFSTMVIVLMKETRLVVMVDDLDFGIRDVAFEAKVFNRYGTFDQIANKSMENPSYTYLHCDLLDKAALTTITLKVKSPYIECMSNICKKACL
jgi:hypothetical protein